MLLQVFHQAAHLSAPDAHFLELLFYWHAGRQSPCERKALVNENPFTTLFIAPSPGSRLPAGRGRADFRPLSGKTEANTDGAMIHRQAGLFLAGFNDSGAARHCSGS